MRPGSNRAGVACGGLSHDRTRDKLRTPVPYGRDVSAAEPGRGRRPCRDTGGGFELRRQRVRFARPCLDAVTLELPCPACVL